jgi:hypothetical protein
MKTKDPKSKVERPAADRRMFMKTLVTGTVAAGLAATGKAEAASLADPCFSSGMALYLQEKNARVVTRAAAQFFEFYAADQSLPNFPGGGIWVAVGPRGSASLEELRRLLAAGAYDRLERAISTFHQRVIDLVVDRASPFASLSEVPALAEVSYAGKVLTGGLFVVPGSDVMLSFLPYTGGALNPGAFQLTQYSLRVSTIAPLESLVIARRPVLTDLEQSIFRRVPTDIAAINLGDAGLVSHWGVAAAGAVLAAGFYAGVKVAQWAMDRFHKQHEEQQKQMEAELNGNDQADATDDKNNGGSLSDWMNPVTIDILESMELTAAATRLLQLRSNLVQGKSMAGM